MPRKHLPKALVAALAALAAVPSLAAATTYAPNRFDDPLMPAKSCAPPAPANGCSLRGAIEAAQDFGVALPFASVVRDHLISALAHGQEELDWSSIAHVLARNAGLPESERMTARPAAVLN